MKPKARSFPHPVVGNRDDVPEAAFQATIDIVAEPQRFRVSAITQCSSRTITELLKSGAAANAVHVECGSTMYRTLFEFQGKDGLFELAAQDLVGDVEVMPIVIAKRDIDPYRPAGLHPDYGTAAFRVRKGDILALGEGQRFDADTRHDSLRSVGAIMQIEQMQGSTVEPMKIGLTSAKIMIYLCKKDYEAYRSMKTVPDLANLLTTTIVLPALAHVIVEVRKGDSKELAEYRWYGNLIRRIDELDGADRLEPIVLAQRLLDLPISRALTSAERYATGAAGKGQP